jgi:hypothetical protein
MVSSLHVVGECAAHTLELSQEDRDRHATILAQVREVNNYVPKAGSLRSELPLDDHLAKALTLTFTQLMESFMIPPPQRLLCEGPTSPSQPSILPHIEA